MRPGPLARPALGSLTALLLLACGGDDLLLPSSGTPAELRLVSGDLQQAEAGSPLPDPLIVAAVDAKGRPVEGSRILFRFELDTDGGQVNPDTVQTDASGQATAEVRLGSEVGAHPVEAIVVDGPTGLRVRFLLTALQPEPVGGGGGGGSGSGGNGGGNDDGGGVDDGGGGGGGGGDVDGGGGDGNDDGGGDGGHGKGGGKGKGKGNDGH
ncbi:MAG TPA: hypothetical protein VFT84_12030 [Gemmatimonadales bacterium]|nr:hypothetical protein [Gemmatimonadales bacterium]